MRPTPSLVEPQKPDSHVLGKAGSMAFPVALNMVDKPLYGWVSYRAISRTHRLNLHPLSIEVGSAAPTEKCAVVDEIRVVVQRGQLCGERCVDNCHDGLYVGIYQRCGGLGQSIQDRNSPLPVAPHPHPLILPLVVDQPCLGRDCVAAHFAQHGVFSGQRCGAFTQSAGRVQQVRS